MKSKHTEASSSRARWVSSLSTSRGGDGRQNDNPPGADLQPGGAPPDDFTMRRRTSSNYSPSSRRHLAVLPEDSPPEIEIDLPDTPGTPPKKMWERQYRNFLKNRSQHKRAVSSGTLDHVTPPASKEDEDSSVRGGKLFAQVFSRSSATETTAASMRRKTKSCDELDAPLRRGSERTYNDGLKKAGDDLDGTLRRGAEKAYASPNAARITAVDTTYGLPPPTPPMLLDSRATSEGKLPSKTTSSKLLETPPRVTGPSVDGVNSTLKKVFTEFHNLDKGKDAQSSFLGDSPYSYRETFLWPNNPYAANSALMLPSVPFTTVASTEGSSVPQHKASIDRYRNSTSADSALMETSGHRRVSIPSSSFGATANDELSMIHTSMRILKPIQSADTWLAGRRYLIAPAAMAACSMSALTALTSVLTFTAIEAAQRPSLFGTIVLGPCLLSYTTINNGLAPSSVVASTSTVKSQLQYSMATLVLRQNYLLEYPHETTSFKGLPRAYANLEYAMCAPHKVFTDALELRFYASPCARSDYRVLVLRLCQTPGQQEDTTKFHSRDEQRQAWMACLNRAANMTIRDLYEYDDSKPLASGHYAAVYKARRQQGAPCALKIFDKNKFWRLVVKGRERADTLVRETSVHATMTARCKNVASFLRLRGIFEMSDHLVIESELLRGTDLFQHIATKSAALNQALTEGEAACILRDVLLCLVAMHRVGVAHRDIKPANILMANTEECVVKVGDFGMATFVGVDGLVRGRCGTPGYVAPEVFSAGFHGGYSNMVDVFSAGVTLYVMLCGYEPFYGETDAKLVQANKDAVVDFPSDDWAHVSPEAKDLVRKMMQADPLRRITPKDALQHEWLLKNTAEVKQQALKVSESDLVDACVLS